MASSWRGLIAAAAAAGLWLAAPAVATAQSLIRDTEIEMIIRSNADPILEASGLDPDDVTILLVNDPTLNAFAIPGQRMGFHTGLILEADTPNQFYGVLAHEAGHISGGHTIRNEMTQAGMKPFLLTMGLGVLAALAGAPDAGALLLANSGYFGTLGALTYSRSQEAAADQAAVTALEGAGMSGRGLVEFFDEFRYQELFSDERRFPFFRSHPLSSDRISALRRRVSGMSHYEVTDSEEALFQHRVMQAKLYAFLNPPAYTLSRYPSSDTSYEARYARAIAAYRAANTDDAIAQIDALLEENPENPFLWELKGQVLFEAGRAAEAEPAHRRSVELLPEAGLLRLNLAQSILAQEDAARAQEGIAELHRSLAFEPDNPFAYLLMSQAYGSIGEDGQARLAQAEYHFALEELEQAQRAAVFARGRLEPGTAPYRRAVDIILASGATLEDIEDLDRAEAAGRL
ncbi:M48 family metalloprotease [Brevundimonas sp.]|uniref:M48 family metalloprotease n=1 Tax=Brevundimonas sp. TaxID=1871086 RepID=UPI0025EE9B49|nr:M48 family metalloprotease [Brevundimonas sp.]